MAGVVMERTKEEEAVSEMNGNGVLVKEASSPDNTGLDGTVNGVVHEEGNGHGDESSAAAHETVVDTSIEQLYENVCDMQSSDQSPSRHSFGSYGAESRIDSELRHLLGGEMKEIEIMEEEVDKPEDDSHMNNSSPKIEKSEEVGKSVSSGHSKKNLALENEASSVNGNALSERPPLEKRNGKPAKRVGVEALRKRKKSLGGSKLHNGAEDSSEPGLDNPDLGRFLLKQARDLVSSGDGSQKALDLSLRAVKAFESCVGGKPSLELVMSLHVAAAIHCSIGQYTEAIPVLEQSIEIPVIAQGQEHALAKFAGYMQLGDTYAMLGQLENSTKCYTKGLEIQKQVLGANDPRIGETCRYLAEAHVQALQFDDAKNLCQMALDIHRENGAPASLEEAADRRLMGLICETKGDHEAALEHLVLASMAMVANGQEDEVAGVDCSIGDAYLSLTRYDEAIFAYQKALTSLKTKKGENHPAVGSVFVRLADLYNKTGKLKEAKSYCENGLRIYEKPAPGIPPEEIASGLTDISAIYESMNELEQAIKLLEKALKMYNDAPGQQSTMAGIEAQIGVLYFMLGNYSESYNSFKSAVAKLRTSGEKKSAFFGIALNQMGLTCVQRFAVKEAVELFEEAKDVLEQECGPDHPDTLGVYSNLAGTYDAMGRLEDAIKLLEHVIQVREDKLGTANPDIVDEKKRLGELLKEAGRVRSRKARSLENLLDNGTNKDVITLQ
ncbi:Protein KINESIN LIGHT CHAIN-RELATED 3 [Linum grandiflorum]